MLKHYRNTLLDMSTIPGIYVTKITQNLKKKQVSTLIINKSNVQHQRATVRQNLGCKPGPGSKPSLYATSISFVVTSAWENGQPTKHYNINSKVEAYTFNEDTWSEKSRKEIQVRR